MKSKLNLWVRKSGFLVVLAFGIAIGSLSVGIVAASTTDGGEGITMCKSDIGGSVRIVDLLGSCSLGETEVNLTESVLNSSTGYFRVKDGQVDTATLRNIEQYQWYDGTGLYSGATGYCINTAFTPVISRGSNLTSLATEVIYLRSDGAAAEFEVESNCGSEFNAFMYSGDPADEVAMWFSR
jgi:hypothetical protein